MHKGTVGHLKVLKSEHEQQKPDTLTYFLCQSFGWRILVYGSILRTQVHLILTSPTTSTSTTILARNCWQTSLLRSIGHPSDIQHQAWTRSPRTDTYFTHLEHEITDFSCFLFRNSNCINCPSTTKYERVNNVDSHV